MNFVNLQGKLPSARWLWAAVILTMAVMIVTQAYLIEEEREQILSRSSDAQHSLVDSIANRIEATIEKADMLSQRLADDLASTPERVARASYQQKLYETISANKDFDSALLIHADGSFANGSIPFLGPPPTFSDRAYFIFHRSHADQTMLIWAPLIDKITGQRIIPMTRRVNDRHGNFIGVVVLTFAIDAIQREFLRYYRGKGSFLGLAHLDGTILLRVPRLESTSVSNIRNSSQYKNHYLKQFSGEFSDTSPVDHVVRRYYYRNLKAYPLLVVEGINEKALIDETVPIIRLKALLLGSLTALVGGLTFYLIRLLHATKRTANEARVALAKMSTFQSALDDYVIVALLDSDGYVIDVNERFCRLSGFSHEELVGRLLPPIDGRVNDPVFAKTLLSTLAHGESWRGTRLAQNKMGETFWLQSCILPIAASRGEKQMFLLAQTDITSVKSAQQQTAEINKALSQTLSLNLAILNSTRCGIFATDERGVIVLFNAAAEGLLGYERIDVLDQLSPVRFYDADSVQSGLLATESHQSMDARPYDDFISLLTQNENTEWCWLKKDGTPLQVAVTTMPILDMDKHVRGHVTVFDDLSEKKKLEAMKSDFVSVVSHELRTPLTSIKGSLSLLKSTLAPILDTGKMKLLDIGVDNCDKLVRLVSDILDIDKLSRGQMSLECQPQSLIPVIERALAMNAPYAAQLNVRYEFVPMADAGIVNIDADRMLQVLTNLLSNAAKFSSAGQTVTIFIEQNDVQITVGVRDQGAGIPEAFKDKVFERFTQSGSVNTKNKPGSGLGLTIARSLVELHDGTIWFESQEGMGTTFYLSLPRVTMPVTGRTLADLMG